MGYSALHTAFAVSPLALPLLIFSVLSPWYLPRLGLRTVIFAAMLLLSIGFLCMRTLGPHAAFFDLFWPQLVVGSGFGLCTARTTRIPLGQ